MQDMRKLYHNWKYVISRTISGLQQFLASLRKPTEKVVNSATVANPTKNHKYLSTWHRPKFGCILVFVLN